MNVNNLELTPLKDFVCLMTIDPRRAAAMVEHKGQAYYFCSEGCRQKFWRSLRYSLITRLACG